MVLKAASWVLVLALSLSSVTFNKVVKANKADLIRTLLPDNDQTDELDNVSAATGEVAMTGITSHVFTFFLAPHYFNWTDKGRGVDKDLVRYR